MNSNSSFVFIFVTLGAIDHYSQYTDNLDVHFSSGVYNKAWCLLKNTAGWNYIRAFEVHVLLNSSNIIIKGEKLGILYANYQCPFLFV